MNASAGDIRVKAGKWPRLGFLGTGRRLKQQRSGTLPNDVDEVRALAHYTRFVGDGENAFQYDTALLDSPEDLLESEIGGLVIVAPSKSHVDWIIDSLKHGIPVFCQEPPILNSAEARQVVDTAKTYDCLFAINFPYRNIKGMPELREHIRRGDLGKIHNLDLTFRCGKNGVQDAVFGENAGLINITFHLVDLILWLFDCPRVTDMKVYHPLKEISLTPLMSKQRDYALAQLGLGNGATVKLNYSQRETRCDAAIDMGIFGAHDGGMYGGDNDSLLRFMVGRSLNLKESMPDHDWRNRALVEWLDSLHLSPNYNAGVESFVDIAEFFERAGNFCTNLSRCDSSVKAE